MKSCCTLMMAFWLVGFCGTGPAQDIIRPAGAVIPLHRQEEIIGSVRLTNGMILKGLCTNNSTILPDLLDRKLELRQVSDHIRTWLVSNRRSDPPQADNLALPAHQYRIRQRRTSQRPLNYEIGLHERAPFQPDGTSTVTLLAEGGRKVEIQVGITSIDAGHVQVSGLSHQWEFGLSMLAIPEDLLFTSDDTPGLLKLIPEYKVGAERLDMAMMLLQAEKFHASRSLLESIPLQFPELQARCDTLTETWNDVVGRKILTELELLRQTGKFETAKVYARAWPDRKLAPVVRVKAKLFLDQQEADDRRLASLQDTLNQLLAEIENPDIRREAGRICTEVRRELDLNTVNRLTAFELLKSDAKLTAESRIALAASGLILGADRAIDNFQEAAGLLQVRAGIEDYLRSAPGEDTTRNQRLEFIRQQEGFSVERLDLLLRNLPPVLPITIETSGERAGQFVLESTSGLPNCLGKVPDEYARTRRYPLLIALPRGGLSAEDTLNWWAATANREGYIVVVPELYEANEGTYAATAGQHQQAVSLIRHLKKTVSIDDNRVFIAGHGIGGEAAMDIATAHPDLFAGVLSLGGLGRNHLKWTAQNSTGLPWYVVAGSLQPGCFPRLAPLMERLFKRSSSRSGSEFCDVLFCRYDQRGFESFSEELPNLFRWMNLQQRNPWPTRIDATTLRSTDLDWYWLSVNSIPSSFSSLDDGSTFETTPTGNGHVTAELSASNGNLIRLRAVPADAVVYLSPEMPDIDLQQPIRIIRVSGKSIKVDYAPSSRDLLEHFYIHRDRSRTCMMKIDVPK
ncbi:MAG: hypothetical protein R3C49_17535 [Planctomycetaceae bacterium]